MHNHSATIDHGSFGGRFSVSRRPWMLLFIPIVLLVAAAPGAVAGSITTFPSSLSPGDDYRLAFVSSALRNATSSNIADYNAFVDALGDTLITSDWRAIASTSSVDARDNTGTLPSFAGGSLGVPIFVLNDTKLVDNNDDLWDGAIGTFLRINDLGNVSGSTVWTGTVDDGRKSPFAFMGNGDDTQVGQAMFLNNRWIEFTLRPDSQNLALYALSGVLRIPTVPEPGSLVLLSIGAAMLTGAARLRRRKRASESS